MPGTYREWAPGAALREHTSRVWYRRVGSDDAAAVRIVPDGCIDLIWMNGEVHVAGPDTTAWLSRNAAGTEIVGARFHPGAAPPILGVPASELVNLRVPISDLWGRPRAALSADTPGTAMRMLQDLIRRRADEAPAVDPVVRRFVELARTPRQRPLPELEQMFGLSERQLRRRCDTALGYGPKTLSRILRFQHFLALARRARAGSLAQVAADAGYADQPHLTRDVVRLTGLPPAALVASLANN